MAKNSCPNLLAPCRKDQPVECHICQGNAVIPFQCCGHHLACYRCLWLTTIHGQVDYNETKIKYTALCPFCRTNALTIENSTPQHVSCLKGAIPVADDILEKLFGTKVMACPFECGVEDGVVAMKTHVERCERRPLKCPRVCLEGEFFSCNPGWQAHTKTQCARVCCGVCTFRGTWPQVEAHRRVHLVTKKLTDTLHGMWLVTKDWNMVDYPEFGSLPMAEVERRIHLFVKKLGHPERLMASILNQKEVG